MFYTLGLKLPLSKRKIALLLKNGKKSSFFEEFKTPSKFFSISEGPEKNFLGPKKFMGVFYIAKLEFWLQNRYLSRKDQGEISVGS